ncbi:MAG: tetratricopeptide repeat protein, partial [Myxococcota bacterium]
TARSLGDIWSATASALNLQLSTEPETQLIEALRSAGSCLLILDNFEHLVEHSAQTIGRWLDAAPSARILVTSRVPLHLQGEQLYPLDLLSEADAVALFADRAQKMNRHFQLTDGNRTHVIELVHLLDRLPLAIELAAARSRMLSPKTLLARMSRRFDVLKSRARDLPERQRTMRATLEWSWELLDDTERTVLAQCSVFSGGIDLEIAAEILETDGALWIEDLLAELIDKSLLLSDDGRVSMLMSVRDFAAEKLPTQDAIALRHGTFFADFAADPDRSLLELVRERGNLKVACERAIARNDPDVAGPCAIATARLYGDQGPYLEGVHFVETVLATISLPLADQAALQRLRGTLLMDAGDLTQAQEIIQMALHHAEASGDRAEQVRTLNIAGILQQRFGQVAAAEKIFQRSLALSHQLGDMVKVCQTHCMLGEALAFLGQRDLAVEHLQKGLDIATALGRKKIEANCLVRIGSITLAWSQHRSARTYFHRALDIAVEIGDVRVEATAQGYLGVSLLQEQRLEDAIQHLLRAKTRFTRLNEKSAINQALGHLGVIYQQQGNFEAAFGAIQEALDMVRETGERRAEAMWLRKMGELMVAWERLDDALGHFADAQALSHEIDDPRGEIAAWILLGRTHHRTGDVDASDDALHAARPLQRATNDRKGEGALLGLMGQLSGERGAFDRGRASLDAGAAILQAEGDRTGLVMLQLRRAGLEARAGAIADAQDAWTQAQALISRRELSDHVEIKALSAETLPLLRAAGALPE